MSKRVGVFLTRIQPLHLGHLGIIEMALKENDEVIVLIGSKNKSGTKRNPLDIKLRRDILNEALEEKFGNDLKNRIIVSELPDWSMETELESNHEWGKYLYYNIVALAEKKQFSMYFSDEKEIIEAWFEDYLKERITLRLFERNNMFNAISSTKIREAFICGNKEYIEKSCPSAVIKRYDEIKEIIKKVYNNPINDYKMEE